jgi:hypothetical protein
MKALDDVMVEAAGKIEAALARGEVDEANKLTYNLAADLAEGWPGDERPRERRHLEAGLAAAERCLAWRRELKKGPRPFAIAHWVHGVHLLSLGRAQDAVAALQRSVEAAHESGDPYLVNINSGFLGIALQKAAREAFAAGDNDDAKYGLANLEAAAKMFS